MLPLRSFLPGVLSVFLVLSVTFAVAAPRPNIVFVITDDQGYGADAVGLHVDNATAVDHGHGHPLRLGAHHRLSDARIDSGTGRERRRFGGENRAGNRGVEEHRVQPARPELKPAGGPLASAVRV